MKMKAYIIGCGRLHNDINMSFACSNVATRSNTKVETVWYTSPCYAVLIDHPTAGWILYDTGSAPNSNDLWPDSVTESCYYTPVEGEVMEEQLAKLGLKPSDIKHVICSHLHMDHIGNIQLFKDTAQIYVSRAEAANAFTTVMKTTDPRAHGFYYRPDVLADIKNFNYIDEDCELFEGIDAVILPGHTPGIVGVVLHMENRTVIITSDAFNAKRNYDGVLPGVIADTVSFQNSRKKVKTLEKKYNAEVWFGHDIDQYEAWKKIPEYYD